MAQRTAGLGPVLARIAVGVILLAAWRVPAAGAPPVEVPDAAAQADALKVVKGIHADDYAKARRDPSARIALARKLMADAQSVAAVPASQFALLHEAMDLAVAAEDLATALEAIDLLAGTFAINGMEEKVAAVAVVARNVSGDSAIEILTLAGSLLDEAIESDNYDLGLRLGGILNSLAAKTKDTAQVVALQGRIADLRLLKAEYVKVKSDIETLRGVPGDPAMNLNVGRFYCLFKGNWSRGLPLLSECSDAKLKELAVKEVTVGSDAASQAEVADAWWMMAERLPPLAKASMRLHAADIYQRNLLSLAGPAAAQAKQRLAAAPSPHLLRIRRTPLPSDRPGILRSLTGHLAQVSEVAFFPDGRRLASGSHDGTVRIWDVVTGKELSKLETDAAVRIGGIAVALDGRHVAAQEISTKRIRVWDTRTGTVALDKIGGNVASSPRANRLAIFAKRGVDIVELPSGKVLTRIAVDADLGGNGAAGSIRFSPDGRMLGVALNDPVDPVRIYDAETGLLLRKMRFEYPQYVGGVGFAPDSMSMLVVNIGYGPMVLFDLPAATEVARTQLAGRVAMSPTERMALAFEGGRLQQWDLDGFVKTLEWDVASDKRISCVCYSPDGRFAVCGTVSGDILIVPVPSK